METLSKSTKETEGLARSIASKLAPGDVLALYGDLGSGKTTFTNFLTKALGSDYRVQSPTFVILRKYGGGSGSIKTVNHLDLYRLSNPSELEDIGIEELVNEPGAITVIEWPELLENTLPTRTIKIRFEGAGESERKINVENLH